MIRNIGFGRPENLPDMALPWQVVRTTPYTRGSQEGGSCAKPKLPHTTATTTASTTTSCRRWAVDGEFVYIERTGRTDGRTADGRTDGPTDGGRTDGRTADGRTDGREAFAQEACAVPDASPPMLSKQSEPSEATTCLICARSETQMPSPPPLLPPPFLPLTPSGGRVWGRLYTKIVIENIGFGSRKGGQNYKIVTENIGFGSQRGGQIYKIVKENIGFGFRKGG